MHLTIDELLDYTGEERSKWESWFATHGDDPLKLAVPMDVHPTVGALIAHCLWAELFYAHWMQGNILPQERMMEIIHSIDTTQADQLFAFGHSSLHNRELVTDHLRGLIQPRCLSEAYHVCT